MVAFCFLSNLFFLIFFDKKFKEFSLNTILDHPKNEEICILC